MNRLLLIIIALVITLTGTYTVNSMDEKKEKSKMAQPEETATVVFAGGCFWCTESDFEKIDGVIEAVSGYTGGSEVNPTYKQVSAGATGHLEAVHVEYDPARISYSELLDIFWRHVDPTDGGGQFVDRGSQYRSAVFYNNEKEKRLAEASKEELAASGKFDKPIATEILPLGPFYPAEGYHQDYYKKNPLRYRFYRSGSGRDHFLKKTWAGDKMKMAKKEMTPGSKSNDSMKKNDMNEKNNKTKYTVPDDEQLSKTLTPLQFRVTRKDGTEPPFNNEYWNNHDKGIYVDIISGEPLFSSTDKFDSGTGWPSFTRPLAPANVIEKKDTSHFMVRTEVRSKHADSHLGHVFDDGPAPTGLRYCINSASLRFIPADTLEKEGYAQYKNLFNLN